MPEEPENLVLHLLRDMRTEMHGIRDELKADISSLRAELRGIRDELKADVSSLRADVAADLLTTRKEINEQIVGLRRAVVEYHSVVIGHGIMMSDLEARVRRIEQRLDLPPTEAL